MQHPPMAFIDIETTGSRATTDRIIEVAVIRMENNKVVSRFQTLINPQSYISPFIEEITHISQSDIEDAPVFSEIIPDLLNILDGCIFVAHNVRFDYGFIRNELRRHSIPFSSKQLCTVKLSRLLFPQHHSHNLDAIIERFSIECSNRHRAMGDTEVLLEFLNRCRNMFGEEKVYEAVKSLIRQPSLPPNANHNMINSLPDTPGVYIFYGEQKMPLYVGKSKNIRERVLSHFNDDLNSSKEMNIALQLKDVDYIETAGELGALLKESQMIKDMQPLYNRRLRISRKMVLLEDFLDNDGYLCIHMKETDHIGIDDLSHIQGIFQSRKQAKEYMSELVGSHGLCEMKLGLSKGKGACFAHKLGRCKGACVGKDKPTIYNARFALAFTRRKIKEWPFAGPIQYIERSSASGVSDVFTVDKWCIIGYSHFDHDAENKQEHDYVFDLDVYKILKQFINDPQNRKNIKPVIPFTP